MKKCFIILQFGSKHTWMPHFIDNVSKLGQYGWDWKIFTPNPYKDLPENVEAIKMSIDEFCTLVEEKTGVLPKISITPKGIPSVHVTDFMVAYGKIFEDYLTGYDFWGMMGGPDIVFGRLDHLLPDGDLAACDVFTDDTKAINGCFTLVRNREDLNLLFKKIPNWKEAFTQPPCLRCTTGVGEHTLYGTDEYGMTEVMKRVSLRYLHPTYYPLHSHDRLSIHMPVPKLSLKADGSLFELIRDNPPEWAYAHEYFGREILFFHFMRTKGWPL